MADKILPRKFDLTNKTAVVTAGGTGLGYFMTRGLLEQGAKVLIASRREDVLQQAVKDLRNATPKGEISYKTVDLADRRSLEAFAESVNKELGGVDIFIGNAGIDLFERVDDITDAAIDTSLQVNLSANIQLTRAFLPNMRKKKWGRVIFSSSVSSLVSGSTDGMSVYAATKAALNSFARTSAAEVGHDRITVNSLAIGVFGTDMLLQHLQGLDQTYGAGTAKTYTSKISSMTSLGRLGDPEELVGIVQLLASDAGSYITGQSIAIDGGISSTIWPNDSPTCEDIS